MTFTMVTIMDPSRPLIKWAQAIDALLRLVGWGPDHREMPPSCSIPGQLRA